MARYQRVICIVLDGVGVGEAPDAPAFGDVGSNSLGNTARAVGGLHLPNLSRLGLGNIIPIDGVPPAAEPAALHGLMHPRAAGKDSTSGHWELMGCILESPLPTYPDGFPSDVIAAFTSAIGRGVLHNRPASGTEVIQRYGDEHVASGKPIVYTSQDSVFQIAAHEGVVDVDELYRWCKIARGILVPPNGVGRVIARPFAGKTGGYHRTPRRRDFSLEPSCDTVLDVLLRAGKQVLAIGKIDDLFAGRGISRAVHTADNRDGMRATLGAVRESPEHFVFTNLVDFDTMWGHRNDTRAYALGLEDFDSYLSDLLPALGDDDLLIITSDHGNDPTTESTDHSRESVPLLVYSKRLARGGNAGVRETFADAGATVAGALGVTAPAGDNVLPTEKG